MLSPTNAVSAKQLQLDFQASSGLVQRAKQRLMAHGSEIEVGGYRQMGNWWVRIDPDHHNFIFSGEQSRWIDRVTILSDDAFGVLLRNETRRRGE